MDCYRVLGVSHTASLAEIKARYRELILQYHPDKNNSDDASERFQEIKAAYEILKDPAQRKIYDETNQQASTAQQKTRQNRSKSYNKDKRHRNTHTNTRRRPGQMKTKTTRSRTPWLIGIRLRGELRSSIRSYMDAIKPSFGKGRRFPHITLFGPFSTRMGRKQIINAIITMCKRYPEARFSTDGFSSFDKTGWLKKLKQEEGRGIIFAEVKPNEQLKRLRYDIAQLLLLSSQTPQYDRDSKNKFKFHITLAIGKAGDTFKEINKHLKSSKLRYDDVTPELVLYYNKAPVFSYLVGRGTTTVRPRNLYANPE